MPVIVGVALFGAVGVLARYGVDTFVERRSDASFPWATFIVNTSGCLVIGLVIALLVDRRQAPDWLRVGLAVGFCGGYTTFSTFAQESLELLRGDAVAVALLAVTANVVCGVLAVALGLRLGAVV